MIALGLAAIALLYVRGWLRLRSTSPDAIPAWRVGSFLAGLVAIWAATASSLASCDAGSLTAHMVQHLLLMTFAPPLVFLGEPLRALGRGLPSSLSDTSRAFRWRRAGKVLGQPVLCWVAATATLVVWHVPGPFTLALGSHAWHAVEQASFLATGLLFWWPVTPPWPSRTEPRWSSVLYLFFATLPCDILSGFLVFSDRIAYPVYLATSPALAVLEDQQRAGALMWTCVTIVYLVAGAVVSTHLLAPVPERTLRRAEAV
jgi:cytochrome c oxidase assembly factor CtaG